MAVAYIALGANLGRRERNFSRALELLAADGKVRVTAVSSFISSEPVGCPPGSPRFLNAAARLETELPPRVLMTRMLEVERALGRKPSETFGAPRPLDLDLLLYDEVACAVSEGEGADEPSLILPHPMMLSRAFVMEPLAEVAPPETLEWLRRQIGAESE